MKLEVLVSFEEKSAKFVKIQLEISNIHQIKADSMPNFISWRINMLCYSKSQFFRGGLNLAPPWYISVKKYVGIKRVNLSTSVRIPQLPIVRFSIFFP